MSLLDKATIITTPTAHSNGVLHSIKGGSVADFDVVRGSAATRVNAEGLIEDVATNIPRIDYTDGTASILLEPQSTNLITYSEDFSQWLKTGTPTITSNYGVSPNGTQNGTRIEFDADERIRSNFSASGDFTFSVYLKGSGVITLRDNTNVHRQNVTLTSEWARYDLSFNATITSVQIQNQTASIVDCEVWGAQVEALPYATSYIPTSGAIATRLADSVAGAGDATTFNSTEGVLYAEVAALADDGETKRLAISDGGNNNRVFIGYNAANTIQFVIQSSGAIVVNSTFSVSDITQFSKIAIKYKENDCSFWIDGVKVGTDTTASMPTGLNQLLFGQGDSSRPLYGKVKSVITFDTALTDAELECLTTI